MVPPPPRVRASRRRARPPSRRARRALDAHSFRESRALAFVAFARSPTHRFRESRARVHRRRAHRSRREPRARDARLADARATREPRAPAVRRLKTAPNHRHRRHRARPRRARALDARARRDSDSSPFANESAIDASRRVGRDAESPSTRARRGRRRRAKKNDARRSSRVARAKRARTLGRARFRVRGCAVPSAPTSGRAAARIRGIRRRSRKTVRDGSRLDVDPPPRAVQGRSRSRLHFYASPTRVDARIPRPWTPSRRRALREARSARAGGATRWRFARRRAPSSSRRRDASRARDAVSSRWRRTRTVRTRTRC